jgi:putative phosphoesterase
MKLLIVSDTHGRLSCVQKLERRIQEERPDRIIHLGDYLYNGPRNGVPDDYDPLAVSDILNRYARITIGVRGNCDSRIDKTLLKFPMSEDSRVVYLNGFRCDLIHGDLVSSELLEVQRGDILLFGHTHVPMLKKNEGVVYFNPGSPSFPKNGNPPTYGVMEGPRLEIRRLEDGETVAALDLI